MNEITLTKIFIFAGKVVEVFFATHNVHHMLLKTFPAPIVNAGQDLTLMEWHSEIHKRGRGRLKKIMEI